MDRIVEIKARIEKFLELEGQLVTAGPSKADAIIKSQSLIEEHYYADVSDLLEEVERLMHERNNALSLRNIAVKHYNAVYREEEDRPRFNMDAHGNLTLIEEE